MNATRQQYPISDRLLDELDALGEDCLHLGARLFIFGSIAVTYPDSYKGADLDLGFESLDGNPLPPETIREIGNKVDSLSTVRPVDLVDFNRTEIAFQESTKAKRLPLPNSDE